MPRIATKKKPSAAKAKPAKKVVIKLAKEPAAAKPTNAKLKTGAPVPDFKMPATKIGSASRTALKGKPFVMYFYPKDNTSGCTAEACDFRDSAAAFNKLGVTVIGVSKDSLASHEKFAKKFDPRIPARFGRKSPKICEAFGVWIKKSMYGRSYMGVERTTVLVDAKGTIRNVWSKVGVPGHVAEVKKAIAALCKYVGGRAKKSVTSVAEWMIRGEKLEICRACTN